MLSIIIPTLNAATVLGTTLAAFATTNAIAYEIIVADGGSITTPDDLPEGTIVMLYRETELLRKVNWTLTSDLPRAVLEADFDRPWRVLQEIISGARGATRIQVFDADDNMVLDEGPVLGAASLTGGNQFPPCAPHALRGGF